MASEKALNDYGVLTASGTNEFEMLSFTVDGNVYGVNVSKVREIIKYNPITPLPGSDVRILGMTMPRDEIITVVDLRYCLSQKVTEKKETDYFIICHFNKISTAFVVDNVKDIKRFSWNDIVSPTEILNTEDTVITGLIQSGNDLISILDFEKIMTDIDVNNGLTVKDVDNISIENIQATKDKHIKILLAEDSKMLNKLITESITKAGFEVYSCFDGETAYNALKNNYNSAEANRFNCIISDIEMPKMDGMKFCKTVKEDEKYSHIPVIMFSSLIDDQMIRKCASVGANAAMSKPEIGKVISIINELVEASEQGTLKTLEVEKAETK